MLQGFSGSTLSSSQACGKVISKASYGLRRVRKGALLEEIAISSRRGGMQLISEASSFCHGYDECETV